MSKSPVQQLSPVQQFLQTIWDNRKKGSWQRLNAALYDGLTLAIRAGFTFERDDFINLKSFNFHYWCGAGSGPNGHAESFYTLACSSQRDGGNRSAAIAFETWKERKPFLFQGKRLAERSEFDWWDGFPDGLEGEILLEVLRELPVMRRLEVSSFAKDGSYLNAIWFQKPSWEREPGKGPDRRFRITPGDFKRVDKAWKERVEAEKSKLEAEKGNDLESCGCGEGESCIICDEREGV